MCTNFSETQYEITLIAEVPEGSIPVKSQDYLKSTVLTLEPLSTKTQEFLFYFPTPGQFSCYPAAITKDGCLISSANIPEVLKVYKDLPKTELTNMKDILSVGKTEDILNFMRTQNIVDKSVFNFTDIYWLLKDRPFYEEVARILGCSVGTSKSQLHKARLKLRKLLKKKANPRLLPVSS